MKSLIVVLLDAFRWDYINEVDTPYLYNLSQQKDSYFKVTPSRGFCERSEIMSGLKAEESGYFTAIGYVPDSSPYRRLKYILAIFSAISSISKSKLVDKVLRKTIKKFNSFSKNKLNPYNIPYDQLHKYALTEDYFKKADYAEGFDDIKDIAKTLGYVIDLQAFTSLNNKVDLSDDDSLKYAEKIYKNNTKKLTYIYISTADYFGHFLGPDSVEFRGKLRELDSKLELFLGAATSHDTDVLYVGDHGMATVIKRINIKMILERDITIEIDRIFFFLDSTIARIWLDESSNIKDIMSILKGNEELSKYGKLFYADEIMPPSYENDRRYGDILWLANSGVLITPDYFNTDSSNLLGMHGYDPECDDSKGCFISTFPISDYASDSSKEFALNDSFSIMRNHLSVNG